MDLKMAFVNKGSPQVLRQSPFSVLYQLHWTVLPRTLKLESQTCVCVCIKHKTECSQPYGETLVQMRLFSALKVK